MTEALKDSKVSWLGEIPESWSIDRTKFHYLNLKQVAGVKSKDYERLALTLNGVIKRPKDDTDGLQPGDFNGYQILRSGDLVFKLIDLQNVSTSRVGLAHDTGIVSPAYIRLEPRKNDSSRYGEYYFLSMWQREIFNQLGDAGVRSNLSSTDLLELPYIKLPYEDQIKIADFLDEKCAEIDHLSEDIQKQIDTLEEYKKSVITRAVTKGLNPNTEMKDSGIQWIGKMNSAFARKKIKNACSMIGSGTTPQSSNTEFYNDGSINWIQSGDIYGKEEITDVAVKVTPMALHASSSLKVYKAPFIVIAMYGGSVGNTAISRINACTNQAVCCLKPNSDTNLEYLYYWIQFCKEDFLVKAEGGGQPNISQDKIRNQWILLPDIDEQEKIVAYLDKICDEINDSIATKRRQIENLDTYKKSIIYEYVTGKKRVA